MNETEKIKASEQATPDFKKVVRYCALLSMLAVVYYPIPACIAIMKYGVDGLAAAVLAGGACWIGSVAGLAVIGLTKGPQTGVQGILGGKLLGMGLPLATIAAVQITGIPAAHGGILILAVIYFLPTLAVQTILAVRLIGTGGSRSTSTRAGINNTNAETKAS